MELVTINENNTATINYNGKDTFTAEIKNLFFVKNVLYAKVKCPNWCCNGKTIPLKANNYKLTKTD